MGRGRSFVVGTRSVGGKAYVHVSNGLCFYVSFLRMGPNGKGAFVHAGLGSIMGNCMLRHHFGVNRTLRSIHMRHHPCRCLCRRNRSCVFVGRRACRRVPISGRLVGNISFVGRNRIMSMISSTSARAILCTSIPAGMFLGVACARPNLGNSATAGALGPTAIRANTAMHMPLFIGRNRAVRMSAHSNSCLNHTGWLGSVFVSGNR